MTFSASDVMGRKGGRSVRLEYDVDSPNPAFNGFWLKLNEPAKSFKALIFFIKGDQSAGFTKKLKAEIKFSDQQKSVYLIENITDQYKRYRLEITPPGNKSRLTEFTIVFDDQTSQPKKGAVFLDEIELEKTAP
ncbi:MAG TPA: hypothetical protein VNK26_05120, partial [Pyrinomonadaceae bacterium]|jgi:hypothetical protein|nr:hypothetical protein [Pyrinomonadaceae bacterium]